MVTQVGVVEVVGVVPIRVGQVLQTGDVVGTVELGSVLKGLAVGNAGAGLRRRLQHHPALLIYSPMQLLSLLLVELRF